MDWMNEPVPAPQIQTMLDQFAKVGMLERLDDATGPVNWAPMRELVARLRRAADPASGEVITQGEILEAVTKFRDGVLSQFDNL